MDNVITLHHEQDDIEMEAYMFAGFTEDGRLILHIPEDAGDACQLLIILQKQIYDIMTADEGYLQ